MSHKSKKERDRLDAAATTALLNRADQIVVDVYKDYYVNPWGPNGDDADPYDECGATYDDEPHYENITVKEFIEKESIEVKPDSNRAIGFLDVNHWEVNSWLDKLDQNSSIDFEVCNYDTINCYKLKKG